MSQKTALPKPHEVVAKIQSEWAKFKNNHDGMGLENSTLYFSVYSLFRIISDITGFTIRVDQIACDKEKVDPSAKTFCPVFMPPDLEDYLKGLYDLFSTLPVFCRLTERVRETRQNFGKVRHAMIAEIKEFEPRTPYERVLYAKWLSFFLTNPAHQQASDDIKKKVCKGLFNPGTVNDETIDRMIRYDLLELVVLQMITNRQTLIIPPGSYEHQRPLESVLKEAWLTLKADNTNLCVERGDDSLGARDPLSLVIDRIIYTIKCCDGGVTIGDHPGFDSKPEKPIFYAAFRLKNGLPDMIVNFRKWHANTDPATDEYGRQVLGPLVSFVTLELKPFCERDLNPSLREINRITMPGGISFIPFGGTPKILDLGEGYSAEIIHNPDVELRFNRELVMEELCRITEEFFGPIPGNIYHKLRMANASVAIVRKRDRVVGFVQVGHVPPEAQGDQWTLLFLGTAFNSEAQGRGFLQELNQYFAREFWGKHKLGFRVVTRTANAQVWGAASDNNSGKVFPNAAHIWLFRAVVLVESFVAINFGKDDNFDHKARLMAILQESKHKDMVGRWLQNPSSVELPISRVIWEEFLTNVANVDWDKISKTIGNQARNLKAEFDLQPPGVLSSLFNKKIQEFYETIVNFYNSKQHIPPNQLRQFYDCFKMMSESSQLPRQNEEYERRHLVMLDVYPPQRRYGQVGNFHRDPAARALQSLLLPDRGAAAIVMGHFNVKVLMYLKFKTVLAALRRQAARARE